MRLLLNKYNLQIVFAISLGAGLLAFAFDKELGINLLTEIGGVALTVFVINNIIERRERQKRIAIDQRILREIQFILASYYSIWKHLYWQYAAQEKVENENDLLRVYPEIVRRASIKDHFTAVSIQHPESWELFFYNRSIKECFENYLATLTKEIQTFVNDFKIYIEPELLDLLLSILESQYFKDLIMMNQDATAAILVEIEQDPDRLESYLKADATQHFTQIAALVHYSSSLYNTIAQFKEAKVELYHLKKYFIHPSRQF